MWIVYFDLCAGSIQESSIVLVLEVKGRKGSITKENCMIINLKILRRIDWRGDEIGDYKNG